MCARGCGNGVIDHALGETCDVGGAQAEAGCCRILTLTLTLTLALTITLSLSLTLTLTLTRTHPNPNPN